MESKLGPEAEEETLAARYGKFLAIGASDRMEAMAGPETRRIGLQGKTLVSGILRTLHFLRVEHWLFRQIPAMGRHPPNALQSTAIYGVADCSRGFTRTSISTFCPPPPRVIPLKGVTSP